MVWPRWAEAATGNHRCGDGTIHCNLHLFELVELRFYCERQSMHFDWQTQAQHFILHGVCRSYSQSDSLKKEPKAHCSVSTQLISNLNMCVCVCVCVNGAVKKNRNIIRIFAFGLASYIGS